MSKSSTVKAEFEQALAQNKQPNCPYCQQPLVVEQVQTEIPLWLWNSERQRYEIGDEDGHADDPTCLNCGASDPDFLWSSSEVSDLCERLGLVCAASGQR